METFKRYAIAAAKTLFFILAALTAAAGCLAFAFYEALAK